MYMLGIAESLLVDNVMPEYSLNLLSEYGSKHTWKNVFMLICGKYLSLQVLCVRDCTGATGNVSIDSRGDRLTRYTVWSYNSSLETYFDFMQADFSKPNDQVDSHFLQIKQNEVT